VLGGIEASSIRTVARRLGGGEVSTNGIANRRWGRGHEGGGKGTYSSTRALAINESTMRLLGVWWDERVRMEKGREGVHMVERARVWRAVEGVGRGSRHWEVGYGRI